jgi:hypothetical protein
MFGERLITGGKDESLGAAERSETRGTRLTSRPLRQHFSIINARHRLPVRIGDLKTAGAVTLHRIARRAATQPVVSSDHGGLQRGSSILSSARTCPERLQTRWKKVGMDLLTYSEC